MNSKTIPKPLPIRLPSTLTRHNLCQVFYTPAFAPWLWDRDQLVSHQVTKPYKSSSQHNIAVLKLADEYQNMISRDTLRWQVISNTAAKELPKMVMREHMRRRLREAFREALREAGYDLKGRRVSVDESLMLSKPEERQEQAHSTKGHKGDTMGMAAPPQRDIKGTLELHCRSRAALDMDFPLLVENCCHILSRVLDHADSETEQRSSPLPGTNTPWWAQSTTALRQ